MLSRPVTHSLFAGGWYWCALDAETPEVKRELGGEEAIDVWSGGNVHEKRCFHNGGKQRINASYHVFE